MNITVSGVTTMQQLLELDSLDIDFVGLVFNPSSPQYIGKHIHVEQITSVDFDIKKVGIFVNAPLDEILENVERYRLDLVQLEGNESTDFCRQLSEQVTLIRKIYLDEYSAEGLSDQFLMYDDSCDYFSFDFSSEKKEVPQTQRDVINQMQIQKPFFLGGNSTKPSDARFLNNFRHPDFFGVELNRHFEKTPGIKDMALVLTFVQAIRQVNN